MKFFAILLLFAYAYASATNSGSVSVSASAKSLGGLKKRASTCRIGSCTDSVNYFFATCGVDTITKNLPCFCSLSASFYEDAFNCISACGGDDTFGSAQEYYNYYCTSDDSNSDEPDEDEDEDSNSGNSNSGNSNSGNSNSGNSNSGNSNSGDSDDSNALLFNGASSDHLISLIGLLVPLLI